MLNLVVVVMFFIRIVFYKNFNFIANGGWWWLVARFIKARVDLHVTSYKVKLNFVKLKQKHCEFDTNFSMKI